MVGAQGDDTVSAGAGADFVSGDLGNDTLMGGGQILVGVTMNSLPTGWIFRN